MPTSLEADAEVHSKRKNFVFDSKTQFNHITNAVTGVTVKRYVV